VFDSIPYDNQSQIILWNDGVKMKLLWVCHGKMTMTLLAIFDPKRSSFHLVAVSYSTILFHHFLLVDYCVYGLSNVRSGVPMCSIDARVVVAQKYQIVCRLSL
jgi:hypothetical protein